MSKISIVTVDFGFFFIRFEMFSISKANVCLIFLSRKHFAELKTLVGNYIFILLVFVFSNFGVL